MVAIRSGALNTGKRSKAAMTKRKLKHGRRNAGVIRFSEAEARRYSGKIKGFPAGKSKPASRGRAKGRKGGRRFKKAGIFSGSGFLGLGRSKRRIRIKNARVRLVPSELPGHHVLEIVASPIEGALDAGFKDLDEIRGSKVKKTANKKRAKKKRNQRPASPAQLAQRKRFAAMSRARSKAAKAAKGSTNPRRVSKRTKRARKIVRAKRQQIVYRRQHGAPVKGKFKWNPAGLAPKYQRMYAAILASIRKRGEYPGREKEVAARTVEEFASKGTVKNPTARRVLARHYRNGVLLNKRAAKPAGKLPNGRRRSNSAAGADVLRQTFVGRKTRKLVSAPAPTGTPQHVTGLGSLVEIETTKEVFGFSPGEAMLVADPSGQHLHIVGNVRTDPGQDFGEVECVTYNATKRHLDNKPTDYFHDFGEDGGKRPRLVSDEEGMLKFRGGAYSIEAAGITG